MFRNLFGQGDLAGADAVLTTGDRLRLAYLGIGLAAAVYLALAGYWTAALLLPLVLLTGLALMAELRRESQDGLYSAIPLILLGMALSIGIGVDFVRLNGDIGRMNTLFKLYLEGWVLFSLAAGYMLWYLGDRGWLSRIWSWDGWGAKLAWTGILAILLASSLIYPILGAKASPALSANRYSRQPGRSNDTDRDEPPGLPGNPPRCPGANGRLPGPTLGPTTGPLPDKPPAPCKPSLPATRVYPQSGR